MVAPDVMEEGKGNIRVLALVKSDLVSQVNIS